MPLKQLVKRPIQVLSSRFGQHRKKVGQPRLWIMMYHRILPKDDPRFRDEEPGMLVQPDTLAMHCEVLGNEFELVDLTSWCEKATNGGELPENACAITFDDGWLDNYQYAFPILNKLKIPATLYAVSDLIGTKDLFWPNRLARLVQHPGIEAAEFPWLNQVKQQGALNNEALASTIYNLKSFDDASILGWLDDAEERLSIAEEKEPSLMSWAQLKEMAESPFITIGSHTCRHFRMRSELDSAVMTAEIQDSKRRLEQELSQTVKAFCYPNGDFTSNAVSLAKETYQSAVTTQVGINHLDNLNLHQLLRIGVHEDISNDPTKLLAKVACWP